MNAAGLALVSCLLAAPDDTGRPEEPSGASARFRGPMEVERVCGEDLYRVHCAVRREGDQRRALPLRGAWGSDVPQADGRLLLVNQDFTRESLLDTTAAVTSGCAPAMPSLEFIFNDRDVQAIVDHDRASAEVAPIHTRWLSASDRRSAVRGATPARGAGVRPFELEFVRVAQGALAIRRRAARRSGGRRWPAASPP